MTKPTMRVQEIQTTHTVTDTVITKLCAVEGATATDANATTEETAKSNGNKEVTDAAKRP